MPLIRPHVPSLHPYSPGKPIDEVRRELGLERIVKLASNENPIGPSPRAIEAVTRAAQTMHLYPDASAHTLVHALATRLGLSPECIVLGNGSDELIHLLGLVALDGPETELLMGDPSFVRYDSSALLAQARLVKVPVDADLRLDLPAMARAINDRTRLIYLANPNNPTGTIVRRNDFEAFLRDVPGEALVVLDEAYYEYAMDVPDYPRSLDYVSRDERVFALRTFSKAYGLAGIRVGYGFGSPAIVDAIHRVREPFNVNSLAQAAALVALDDEDYLQRSITSNRAGLQRIATVLRRVGARPFESYANFVLADLGRPAQPVFEALLRRGVIVRAGSMMGHPNYLRVSVGKPDELDLFEEALIDVMAQPVEAR